MTARPGRHLSVKAVVVAVGCAPGVALGGLALVLALGALIGACADQDAPFSPPGAIRNITIFPAEESGAPVVEAGPVSAEGKEAFVTQVHASVQPTCAPGCHVAGGSAGAINVFFGADAPASYDLFKAKAFDRAGCRFYVKGAHSGPALTDPQKAILDAWYAKEAAGAGGVADAAAE